MKKHIYSLVASILLLMICMLAGCNDSKISESLDVVSDSMRADIASMGIVQKGHIKSDYTPYDAYTIDEVSIIKRSISEDGKKDTVYCEVVMHNIYYRTTFEAELTYKFYEVGGWICDSKRVCANSSVPIGAVSKDHLNDIVVEVEKREVTLTSSNVQMIGFDASLWSCAIYYEYRDDIFEFYGYNIISFKDGQWERLSADNHTKLRVSPSWNSGNYYPYETTFEYDGLLYEPGNAIYSPKYYPNAEWKAQDKTLTVQNPWLRCNINIDEISMPEGIVRGSFSIEDNHPGKWPNPKEKVSKEFETTINKATGAFSIDAEVELFSYSYRGFVALDNPCYTPAKIRIDAKYNFSSNKWYFEPVIEKLLLN